MPVMPLISAQNQNISQGNTILACFADYPCAFKLDNLNNEYVYDENYSVYGSAPYEKLNNIKLSNFLYAQALQILSDILNNLHKTKWSERDWEIILGNYLIRHARVFVNRSKSLSQLFNNLNVDEVVVREDDIKRLASSDTSSAIWDFSDYRWNEQYYRYLITSNSDKNFKLTEIARLPVNINTEKKNSIKLLVKKFLNFSSLGLRYFKNDEDVFYSKLYTSKLDYLYLAWKLKQVPQFYYERYREKNSSYSLEIREHLLSEIPRKLNYDLRIFIELLFLSLPRCYIENYGELIKQVNNVDWPRKTRAIVTANDFDSNDLFKVWTATKRKSGAKYITLQHGATYGTDMLSKPSVEELTSDLFLTWGWKGNLGNTVQAGMQATVYKRSIRNKKKKILLVQRAPYQKVQTYDVNYEFYQAFQSQCNFIKNLHPAIRNNVIVRLQSDWRYHSFNDYQRWSELVGPANIDLGNRSLSSAQHKYLLLIFSYESTGFLQSISGNRPTVAVWNNIIEYASEEVKLIYIEMLRVGILHDGYKSLGDFLNNHDLERWWLSDDVQAVRKRFAEKFCSSESMIEKLHVILNRSVS